jgi:hypothetical protein
VLLESYLGSNGMAAALMMDATEKRLGQQDEIEWTALLFPSTLAERFAPARKLVAVVDPRVRRAKACGNARLWGHSHPTSLGVINSKFRGIEEKL